MVVMTTDMVIQSTDTLFPLHLYTQLITILLVSITGISFAAGSFIMMNVLLAAGIERLWEFGIRLVIGARRRDILYQLLFEAFLLSTVGGVSGGACGLLIGFALTSLLGVPYAMHPVPIVLLIGASVISGTVGGLYPALKAAQQSVERMLHS
jgi:putative ABC transport system permease protein